MTEAQQALQEIRSLSSKFDDLSLQIRIDTPWIRLRENVRHAVNLITEIPIFARICVLAGTLLLTVPYVFHVQPDLKKKLLMFAIDLFSLAIVVVGTR